ncbi:MAG: AmmeMemoRadiSam system protein B [bacterium]|nr:AmmeMemoRadiSam system protein B [bacterium]
MKRSIFIGLIFLAIFCEGQEKEVRVMRIRKPAAIGFYPGDRKACEDMVKGFLSEAKKVVDTKSKILIVPHAGYVYSGRAAAEAFKQIEGNDYETAIILGVPHHYPLGRPSIYLGDGYETPLGTLSIDKERAEKIAEACGLSEATEADAPEHSIEVQLPYLKVLFPNIKIVPILVGNIDLDEFDRLASAIKSVMDNKTIVIVSTDLSHYPEYEKANKVDRKTISLIENLDEMGILQREMDLCSSKIPDLSTYLCGISPTIIGLKIANLLKVKPKTLIYYNSGDTPYGEKNRVVGYTGIAFIKEGLNKEEKEELLMIAEDTMKLFVKEGKIPEISLKNPRLAERAGVFVTLEKHRSLRGCIGYIWPIKPLYQAVIENVINAAVKDYRFSPVTVDELKDIEIELSVLTPPEKVGTWTDILLGSDGIVLNVAGRQSVFLPQVAPEQGWTLPETLMHLSLKAGLDEDAYKRKDAIFEVFQAEVFSKE